MHITINSDENEAYGDNKDLINSLSALVRMPQITSNLPPISPASTPSGPSNAKQNERTIASVSITNLSSPPPPPAGSPCGSSPAHSSSPFSSPASGNHKTVGLIEFLPPDYEPGHWDVICQRGKTCDDHVGNRRFRLCVESHVEAYMSARSRQAKSDVISAVVRNIRRCTGKKGGFVMKDPKTKRWHHVDSKVARDKVGNALRDAVKQKLEESSQNRILGFERSGSSASFISDSTADNMNRTSVPSMMSSSASMSLMNNSLRWNESASNGIFTINGNDEEREQSAELEQLGNDSINVAIPAFNNTTGSINHLQPALSCPSLIGGSHDTNSNHNEMVNQRSLLIRTPRANVPRSMGWKNELWSNTFSNSNIQNNRFLHQSYSDQSLQHGQLLRGMNWGGNCSSSSNNNNSSFQSQLQHQSSLRTDNSNLYTPLVHFPTQPASLDDLPSPHNSMMVNNDVSNNALHAALLSSDIGELQISNSGGDGGGNLMDFSLSSTGSVSDSAERLSRDIEDFLKSVKNTTSGGGVNNGCAFDQMNMI
ncbi:hypothetical protein IV203_014093 [Nitzschia inconspicua]|uniref:DUF6824 domain-containing protein n=1 Tax=Nitzschia inconspicua TaxID=303405 RepID=A0A9K3Q8J9_9STRA|nr:hypothetical protein IV203_014093 [Nitzschia inconspicua]